MLNPISKINKMCYSSPEDLRGSVVSSLVYAMLDANFRASTDYIINPHIYSSSRSHVNECRRERYKYIAFGFRVKLPVFLFMIY